MKTATVRELRNHYAELLRRVQAGEEIAISQRGKIVARLVPEPPAASPRKVDWTKSAAFSLDRTGARFLTAAESEALRQDAAGRW